MDSKSTCSRMTYNMQMFVDCGDENGVYRLTVGPQIFDPEPYGRGFLCQRGRFTSSSTAVSS